MKHGVQLTILAVAMGLSALPAQAAIITVAAGEVAVTTNGVCSLREAMRNAEADSDTSSGDCVAGSGADVIELAAGSTYTLSDAYQQVELGTNDNDSGLPGVRSSLTINGNGATIQRDPALFTGTACGGAGTKFRILFVPGDGNLVLNNLTLRNGCASGRAGGAIFNHGSLTLDSVTVEYNEGNSGGAIHNNGTLTLTDSSVRDNTNTSAAGGAMVNRGTLQITRSTLSGNTSYGAGGGIDIGGSGSATVTNSTLSGNQSAGLGGALAQPSNSTTSLTNVTLADNTGAYQAGAPGTGSGIYRSSGTVTLANTLLANTVLTNHLDGTNCYGSVSGNAFNLADDASCASATVNAAPLLGPLAANGGPTRTHAPLAGSPAIDAGDNTAAASLTTDQRGEARVIGGTVDIGAFEYGDSDGIAPTEEDTVPSLSGVGNGDGNGDALPDSQQSHVASLNAAAGGGMVTLASGDAGKVLANVQVLPAPGDAPAGVVFPYGLISFTLTGVTPGATENLTMYVPYDAAINGYWKKNKSGQWANIATSITHEGDKTKIVFPLTEGGPFDFDSDPNSITDPSGAAIAAATSIPTLSGWGTSILSSLLALATLWSLGRRRRG